MTRDDVQIIFSNISELAEFADDFVTRLEMALGNVLPNGEGEDRVGALFIEMVRCRSMTLLFLSVGSII
jgi:dynamin-binding protein